MSHREVVRKYTSTVGEGELEIARVDVMRVPETDGVKSNSQYVYKIARGCVEGTMFFYSPIFIELIL